MSLSGVGASWMPRRGAMTMLDLFLEPQISTLTDKNRYKMHVVMFRQKEVGAPNGQGAVGGMGTTPSIGGNSLMPPKTPEGANVHISPA